MATRSSTKQRRVTKRSELDPEPDPDPDASSSKHSGAQERAKPPDRQAKDLDWLSAFLILLVSRYFSARSNLIHDCDEVFNYWEPLHFLLYKSGFQTWEYSSEFALRSYLYLLLHAVVAGPASWWYSGHAEKVQVFFVVRLALGAVSAATEAALCAALSRRYGKRLAMYTLLLLCFTTGMVTASTSFLPSTFSMYGITLAAAAVVANRPCAAVATAAFCVLVGWPFSALAAAPLVLHALATGNFIMVFLAGLGTSTVTLVSSLLVDRLFYERWTSSVLNLVAYNVVGGGGSALYGVEGPLFYLRNLLNNFNLALLCALLSPFVLRISTKGGPDAPRLKYGCLHVLQLSAFLWVGFMTLQAHKEERFLYPVYALICVCAAVTIERLPDFIPQALLDFDDRMKTVSNILRPLALAAVIALSYSRTAALLNGYSAPMDIYRNLPAEKIMSSVVPGTGTSLVCVGSEWHRFPSSFFLPSPSYEVRWLDDGFTGLLPRPFDPAQGGTAAAPSYFNNKNQASAGQFLIGTDKCLYLVELQLERPGISYRGHDEEEWQVVAEKAFLDNGRSAPARRALFIPWYWQKVNVFAGYRLLKKKA